MSQSTLTSLVQAFLISRQAAGLSPRTIEFYEQQLRYFTDWLNQSVAGQQNPRDSVTFTHSLAENSTIGNLSVDTIETYLARRQEEVKQRSVHAAWRAIRAFCNWLESRRERFPDWENPASYVTAPKLPRKKPEPVARDDLEAMLKTCKGHNFFDDRDRAILLFLATSGLRASEFLGLTQGDVDLSSGAVHVDEGKGGAPRMTIISPQARLALADYLSHLVDKDDQKPLWNGRQGPLTYGGLQGVITKRAKQAGIDSPSAHDFRRRWASDMVPKLGPWVVQALGGWSSMQIVQQYVTLSEEDLLDAYDSST